MQTDLNFTHFAQPSNLTSTPYHEEQVTKIFRCEGLYQEYALNKIFIEALDASLRHTMREYCRDKNDANLHDIAFHATSYLVCRGTMQRLNGWRQ